MNELTPESSSTSVRGETHTGRRTGWSASADHERLKRLREAAGLSTRELAARAGTSHSTIIAYEKGRKIPRADTRDRLIRAAGWVPSETTGERRDRRTAFGRHPTDELIDVLSLVDVMPTEHHPQLRAPIFPQRLGPGDTDV